MRLNLVAAAAVAALAGTALALVVPGPGGDSDAISGPLLEPRQTPVLPPLDPFPPPDGFPPYNGTGPTMLRFSCHQAVIDRLDPLITPGRVPSHHQHQIVGGDAFRPAMPPGADVAELATCTTCSYRDDLSNYWTANVYFRARNGSYRRVRQAANNQDFFPDDHYGRRQQGGMTVYYVSEGADNNKTTTAFAPGFRMFVGDALLRAKPTAEDGPWDLRHQTCYRCYNATGFGGDVYAPCIDPDGLDTQGFPDRPCPGGIRSNVLFPTCWDGVNLDSADHRSHVAWPVDGPHNFDGAHTAHACPDSHPVRIPQLMYEIVWDTAEFNDPDLWPEEQDGRSQPFVLSNGDTTGYSQHGDYVFGWRGDSLQVGMDAGCIGANCPGMATQSVEEGLQCVVPEVVGEDYDGCKSFFFLFSFYCILLRLVSLFVFVASVCVLKVMVADDDD